MTDIKKAPPEAAGQGNKSIPIQNKGTEKRKTKTEIVSRVKSELKAFQDVEITTDKGRTIKLSGQLFKSCKNEAEVEQRIRQYRQVESEKENYILVGNHFYYIDEDGVLHKRNAGIIELKYDKYFLKSIASFVSFCNEPSNTNYLQIVNNRWNIASPPCFYPKAGGEFPQIKAMLEHVFGEQIEFGMEYMQVMYLFPKQRLPMLVLASKERETGKTTFINFLTELFCHSSTVIKPEQLSSNFNSSFADKNIIIIDEFVIEKTAVLERLKAMNTQKSIGLERKGVDIETIPFYGKFILATNKTIDFARVDEEENRFWVRGIPTLKGKNKINMLEEMSKEIPAFLHHLSNMPVKVSRGRFWLHEDEYYTSELAEVKANSRVWLQKEIEHLAKDCFLKNTGLDCFQMTASEIKEYWFRNDHRITREYVGRVLSNERNMHRRYVLSHTAVSDTFAHIYIEHPGQVYTFNRIDFIKEEDVNIQE